MFIPPNAPPEAPIPKADNDWSPFTSRAGFELADFLFTDAQLSQRKINHILELWAATLIPHGDSVPISNHLDLHRQIDAIDLGDVQWEHTYLKYEGLLPEATRHPEWKTTEYDIWYRDPRQVIKNILARPDLKGHVDYAAYQEFNGEKRQYGNMMSGDWTWRQSVRFTWLDISADSLTSLSRISLLRTHQHMALCSFQSSLAQTKRLYPSLPVKTIFIRCTSQSETFKITYGVHTRMRWC
jgi:hypothetical protein